MKEYMTIKELGKYLDVSRATIDEWRKKGLGAIKLGGRVYFSAEQVDRFMKEHEVFEYEG